MKDNIKKLLGIGGLLLALSFNAFATVNTVSVATTVATNLPTLLGGGANVIQFTITSAANNVATLTVYDAPTNYYVGTNGLGYSVTGSYVTNTYVLYTNYYGVTNAFTNKFLYDYSNWIPSNVFNYATMYNFTVPTNSTATFVVNARFINGILVTNLGAATFTLSYQYTQ